MKIDLFTFSAQIINFLILVWLLKKVLYKPVLQAMQKREDTIAARLDEAQRKLSEAEIEKQKYKEMQQKLHESVSLEMRRAKEEADKFKEELIESVRLEVNKSRSQWLAAVDLEKESFLRETSHNMTMYFHQLAGKAFKELAGEDLELRVLTIFLDELGKIPAEENRIIRNDLEKNATPIIVSSAFALSPETKDELQKTLAPLWGETTLKEFIVDRTLLAGIQIEAGGKKISWDLGRYLKEFEENLAVSLERENIA
ncbi:MAG: F0F1 ATP synthase subunit delta [Pseudomonadota bacterium]